MNRAYVYDKSELSQQALSQADQLTVEKWVPKPDADLSAFPPPKTWDAVKEDV